MRTDTPVKKKALQTRSQRLHNRFLFPPAQMSGRKFLQKLFLSYKQLLTFYPVCKTRSDKNIEPRFYVSFFLKLCVKLPVFPGKYLLKYLPFLISREISYCLQLPENQASAQIFERQYTKVVFSPNSNCRYLSLSVANCRFYTSKLLGPNPFGKSCANVYALYRSVEEAQNTKKVCGLQNSIIT